MTKKTYACTITKCLMDKEPTKTDILYVRNQFYEDFNANESNFPVNCFEPKKNGWLHYHSTIFAPYIDWQKVRYKGWSIKLKMLKTPFDIVNWCGYIQKHKIDKVDIKYTIKKVQQFKRDKKRISRTPHVSDFSKWLKTESESESDTD